MVTIEQMKNAVGHKVIIALENGSEEETLVESYQYDADEDKEPWIEFSPNRADYQSSIASIEILD